MVRFLLWRLLALVAVLSAFAFAAWFLDGGPGRALRRASREGGVRDPLALLAQTVLSETARLGEVALAWGPARMVLLAVLCASAAVLMLRRRARRRRCYVRLRVDAYRNDRAPADAVVAMFEAMHKRLLVRWWRRLLRGQPSLALEVHYSTANSAPEGWLALGCAETNVAMLEAAVRAGYPNCRLRPIAFTPPRSAVLLRLKKRHEFIKRVKVLDRFEHEREPPVNRLFTAMAACQQSACVQLALTPAPVSFERLAKRLYKRHEARLSRARREHLVVRDRSLVEDSELRGALDVQHRPLFFADIRIVAHNREACERIASELRAEGAENSLVERGAWLRHGLLGLYRRRLCRGEGNPLPSWHRGVFASTELAPLWHLPSGDYSTVPFARTAVPLAPAAPAILRPIDGPGTLRDALGPVCIHPHLRRHNTAVPGAVDQGKTSYLIATVAEDLRRERCAVIVLDPKGDAADAAVSLVPGDRTCTLLDLASPTCGFNPLSVQAPADVIADYVVGALKNLFTDDGGSLQP